MTTAPLSLNLVKDLKRLIWLNTLFLAFVVTLILFSFDISGIVIISTVILAALLMRFGNNLFVNNYYLKKAETEISAIRKETISLDDLTGLFNRRTGMFHLRKEFARRERTGGNMALAMVDIDHFKSINDTHGHQAGDYVLRKVAATLQAGLRKYDVVFRYGGEEFLIVLPNSNEMQAVLPLERVSRQISRMVLTFRGSSLSVSVSIGIATVLESDADETEAINRADQAMYKAKAEGRNKVCAWK